MNADTHCNSRRRWIPLPLSRVRLLAISIAPLGLLTGGLLTVGTALLGAALLDSSASAATVYIGPSTGGVFNDDANWSGLAPGNADPSDIGIFNNGTNVDGTITFNADPTIHRRTFVQNDAGTIAFDTGVYTWTMSELMLVGNTAATGPAVKHIGGEIDFNRILLGTSSGPGASLELTGSNTHYHTRRGSGGYNVGIPADGASILVHNGASMTGDGQALIGLTGSSNSSVVIDGVGSSMSLGNYLGVGHTGSATADATGNRAEIINGATGAAAYTLMGVTAGAIDNTLLVRGTGSTLTFTGVADENGIFNDGQESAIGRSGINNLLQIDQGGVVDGTNVFVLGLNATSTGNQILIDDGSLAGTGIDIRQGNVTVTNGSVDLSQFFNEGDEIFEGGGIIATNGSASTFTFNSGTVASVNADINNGSAFTVGDGGGSSATYNMKQDVDGANGAHSFADGLFVSSNGVVSGNGDIVGNVTGDPGGVVDVGDSPGIINVEGTYNGNLTTLLEIDDVSSSQVAGQDYDMLDITGVFTHGGAVTIDVSEFVASSPAEVLQLIGWGGQAGNSGDTTVSFVGGASLPFEFRSDGLFVTAVPEPGAVALLLLGLGIMVPAHRRRSVAKRSI